MNCEEYVINLLEKLQENYCNANIRVEELEKENKKLAALHYEMSVFLKKSIRKDKDGLYVYNHISKDSLPQLYDFLENVYEESEKEE